MKGIVYKVKLEKVYRSKSIFPVILSDLNSKSLHCNTRIKMFLEKGNGKNASNMMFHSGLDVIVSQMYRATLPENTCLQMMGLLFLQVRAVVLL